MARDSEAKISFTANTSEFTSGIKDMNSTLGSLGKQLTLNSTQLKGNGDSVELLQDKQKILQDRLEASNEKVELTSKCLEEAKEIFGENSEETQKWADKLVVAETQNQRIQNELDKTTNSLDELEQATVDSETALGQLESTIEQQQQELSALSTEYTNVVLEQGESSEEAQNLATEIQGLSDELNGNREKLKEAQSATAELTGEFGNATDETETFGGTLEAVLASEVITTGISKIKEGLTSLIDTYKELDSGYDNLEMATGAQGEALAGLKKDYDNIAGSIEAVGFSQEDLGSIIGEINTQYGYTGEKLVSLSNKMLAYCRVTGADGVESTQTLRKVMDSFNLTEKESIELMDMWASVGQSTGQDVNQLTSTFFNYRAELDAMNISYNTAIPLFAKIQQSGGNVSTVIKGLSTAYKNWTKDGKNANEELQKTFNKIKNAPSDTKAGQIAMDTFGSKAGAELAAQIKTGKLSYEDLINAMSEDYSGTVNNTFNEVTDGMDYFQQACNNTKLVIGDLGGIVLNTLTPALEGIAIATQNVHQWFINLPGGVQTVIGVVAGLAVGLVTLGGIFTVVTIGIGLMNTALGALHVAELLATSGKIILTGATITWNVVAGIATVATTALGAAVAFLLSPIGLVIIAIGLLVAAGVALYKNWDQVSAYASSIWNQITTTIGSAVDWAGEKVQSGFSYINQNIIQPVKDAFGSVRETFNGIYDTINTKINNAKDAVRRGIDAIKGFFSFKFSWPNLPVPHFSINPPGWKIGDLMKGSIPSLGVRWYAKGAIMTQPTLFGGGEAGPEAVLPLNGFYDYLDRKLSTLNSRTETIDYDKLTSSVVSGLEKVGIYMESKPVGRMVAKEVDNVNSATKERLNRLAGVK